MSPWLLLVSSAFAVLFVAIVADRRRGTGPARRGPGPARPCAVYIIPSRTGRPAYIGEGYDPYRRITCHRREAWWWIHVDPDLAPQILWLPSKAAARARETELIRERAPMFNDRHNLGRGHVAHPVG